MRFRCECGQEAILTTISESEFFGTVYNNHSGDPDVMRQSRRLELALKANGWRGSVEALVTREMQGEELEEEFLQVSPFAIAAKKEKQIAESKSARK